MRGDAMKEIKEKPAERAPKNNAAGRIPKAALKKAWTEAKEKKPNQATGRHFHARRR